MNKDILVASGVVTAFAAGAGAGFLFAKKKYENSFEEVIEREIREAKEFYKRTYKVDEFATPEAAVESLGVPDPLLEDATDALRTYLGQDVPDEPEEPVEEEQEIIERNVFDDSELKIDKDNRDKSRPYVVDLDEFMENPHDHEQLQFTYFAGDNVLADEKDKDIPDPDPIVGNMNLMMFGASDPNEKHIVLIRNEKLNLDFEVAYSDKKYTHEVLGYDEEIKHSDTGRRKQRPRWDDE